MTVNQIYCGECSEVMSQWPDECVDMTVTSPPYDNLRNYNGYVFPFEKVAQQLYRVTKQGGVVVWIVNDATINGSETGTSFKQALYFMDIGFKLHDTMTYNKLGVSYPHNKRYHQCFEYMFVLSKGKVGTFYGLRDRINMSAGRIVHGTERQANGKKTRKHGCGKMVPRYGLRFNYWKMSNSRGGIEVGHPAVFPYQLAHDHIVSWSNEGAVVLDPFVGSGTTCLAAIKLNRQFVGIDISREYCDLAQSRIDQELQQKDCSRVNKAADAGRDARARRREKNKMVDTVHPT